MKKITPTYVPSSNLDAIGYRLGKLYVRFKSGASYVYDKVPYDIFDALEKAESVGQAFHRLVKGKYHYDRMKFDPFKEAAGG